jgi:hypothetical protein
VLDVEDGAHRGRAEVEVEVDGVEALQGRPVGEVAGCESAIVLARLTDSRSSCSVFCSGVCKATVYASSWFTLYSASEIIEAASSPRSWLRVARLA